MDGALRASLIKAADAFGSPVYVYDKAAILNRCNALRDGIAFLEFERKASTLREAITSAIHEVEEADVGVRVVRVETAAIVLAANGTVFSAGHDLKEMTGHRTDADGGRAFFQTTMTNCAEDLPRAT